MNYQDSSTDLRPLRRRFHVLAEAQEAHRNNRVTRRALILLAVCSYLTVYVWGVL